MDKRMSSRLKTIEKDTEETYESLDYRERLKLYIRAKIAGNDAEIKRLKETCPRKTYRMGDAEMEDHKNAFDMMLFVASLDVARLQHGVAIIEGMTEAMKIYEGYVQDCSFETFAAGWMHGAKRKTFDSNQFKELPLEEIHRADLSEKFFQIYEDAKKVELVKAKTLWQAYVDTCHEVFGIDEKEILCLCDIERVRDFIESLKPEAIPIDLTQYDENRALMHEVYLREMGGTLQ